MKRVYAFFFLLLPTLTWAQSPGDIYSQFLKKSQLTLESGDINWYKALHAAKTYIKDAIYQGYECDHEDFTLKLSAQGFSDIEVQQFASERILSECLATSINLSTALGLGKKEEACLHFKASAGNYIFSELQKWSKKVTSCIQSENPPPSCGSSYSTPEGKKANLQELKKILTQFEKEIASLQDYFKDPRTFRYLAGLGLTFAELEHNLESLYKDLNFSETSPEQIERIDQKGGEIQEEIEKRLKEAEQVRKTYTQLALCKELLGEKGYSNIPELDAMLTCQNTSTTDQDAINFVVNMDNGMRNNAQKTLFTSIHQQMRMQVLSQYLEGYVGLSGKKPHYLVVCEELGEGFCDQATKDQISAFPAEEISKFNVQREIDKYNRYIETMTEHCKAYKEKKENPQNLLLSAQELKKLKKRWQEENLAHYYAAGYDVKLISLTVLHPDFKKLLGGTFDPSSCYVPKKFKDTYENKNNLLKGMTYLRKYQVDAAKKLKSLKEKVNSSPGELESALTFLIKNSPEAVKAAMKEISSQGSSFQAEALGIELCRTIKSSLDSDRWNHMVDLGINGVLLTSLAASVVLSGGSSAPLLLLALEAGAEIGGITYAVGKYYQAKNSKESLKQQIAANYQDPLTLNLKLNSLDFALKKKTIGLIIATSPFIFKALKHVKVGSKLSTYATSALKNANLGKSALFTKTMNLLSQGKDATKEFAELLAKTINKTPYQQNLAPFFTVMGDVIKTAGKNTALNFVTIMLTHEDPFSPDAMKNIFDRLKISLGLSIFSHSSKSIINLFSQDKLAIVKP